MQSSGKHPGLRGYEILEVKRKLEEQEQTSNGAKQRDQASPDDEGSLTSVRALGRGKVRLPRLAAGAKGSFHALAVDKWRVGGSGCGGEGETGPPELDLGLGLGPGLREGEGEGRREK